MRRPARLLILKAAASGPRLGLVSVEQRPACQEQPLPPHHGSASARPLPRRGRARGGKRPQLRPGSCGHAASTACERYEVLATAPGFYRTAVPQLESALALVKHQCDKGSTAADEV